MATFIALLRGINVGKAKRVPMADLRQMLEGMGYAGVATLLNSGNVVFEAHSGAAARHAADMSAAILGKFKFEVPVIVLSSTDLSAIIAADPIKADAAAHPRLLVAFVQNPKSLAELAALKPLVAPPEQFHLGSKAAYLLCAKGILESKLAAALLGKLGKPVTSRNWATVLKLQALAKATGS